MKNNIFIPTKVNVGFQERHGTYTGKLAYVIYFDEKGKLRKENSWNSWRDQKIDNIIYENEPTEGFVLNKRAGGYSTGWNHRQTYTRVYDPRGFEFEITVENLLYILENTNSIKGKGLEGEFVYGWSGKDLILVPTGSPDYADMVEYNRVIHNNETVKAKDLIIGATYKNKYNENHVYLGKFDYYDPYSAEQDPKKRFVFYHYSKDDYYRKDYNFEYMKSITRKYVKCISEECVDNYAEIIDLLETQKEYSPIDETKSEYIEYTLEELEQIMAKIKKRDYFWFRLERYAIIGSERKCIKITNEYDDDNLILEIQSLGDYYNYKKHKKFNTMQELYDYCTVEYKRTYLVNGKLHLEEKEYE